MLEDIVRFYVSRRCPQCLVYGKLHQDKKHLHFHLAISANGLKARNRHWMSKAQLAQIQRDTENYQIANYPQLGTRRVYNRSQQQKEQDSHQPHLTNREQSYKIRTHQPSRKEQDRVWLKTIFYGATSEKGLAKGLKEAGYTLYRRGNTEGVITHDGRKYRLKTLGLQSEYLTAKKRLILFSHREEELLVRTPTSRDRNQERS